MSAFTIDKNIPLAKRGYAKSPSKYPWLEMSVGDSFLSPNSEGKRNPIPQMCCYWNKDHPETRFSVRSVDGGVRCWRIK